jgi:hypothetical protein
MRDLESLGREELLQIILDQHRLIEQLRAEIEQLRKRVLDNLKGARVPV